MNWDRDIRAVARAAIAEWASAAGEVVSQRVDAHKNSGDAEGCEFWSRVRLAIEELDCERSRLSLPEPSIRTDGGNKPLFWQRMKAAIRGFHRRMVTDNQGSRFRSQTRPSQLKIDHGFLLRKLQNTLPRS